ncbi:hypothetical protein [Clostridium saccharoperbutylacetonicum]|uniref:hypothetical protein n=1 Tax=Clostridium saccharoperbutylacetonicum TaxID=36745 RepID=UPI0039E9B4D1
MKLKKIIQYNFIYLLIITVGVYLFNKLNYMGKIIKYINFETVNFKFQDLLSIGITLLAIFVGAIITVATVLISMCDKRIIRLISNYGKAPILVSSIKISIISGIVATCLLASVYARLDFNIFYLRISLLYIAGLFLYIFISKSKLLITLVINVLNDSFSNGDSIIVDAEFVKPKQNEKQ